MASAYWISPNGEIIPVTTTHIDEVIKNPTIFGYTDEEIKDIFSKFDEPVGLESKAREKIVVDLVKKGWVRIRSYGNKGFSVNIQKLTSRIKDYLFDWSVRLTSPEGLFGAKEKDLYSPIKLETFVDGNIINMTFKDMQSGMLYERNQKFDKANTLVECKLINNKFKKWVDIFKES
jgi:hypothetical protein